MLSLLLLPSLSKISISTLSVQNPKTLFSSTTPKPPLLSHLHLPNQTLISCRSINKKQKKRNDFRVWVDDDDVEPRDPDDYDMDEDEAEELDSKDYDIEYDRLLQHQRRHRDGAERVLHLDSGLGIGQGGGLQDQ
ncbi:hypothetical protein AAC387_Pa11g2017 [Persea americana]